MKMTKALMVMVLTMGTFSASGAVYLYPNTNKLDAVILAWDPPQCTNVIGYNIYFGADGSRQYTNRLNAGNVTNTTVSKLVQGAAYYFAATAYDASGVESVFSNEVNYTVPGPLAPRLNLAKGTNSVALFGQGSPNTHYAIDASENLTAWERIGGARSDRFGWFGFVDLNPCALLRFYRAW
jgi:hypothetical protein